MLPKEGMPVFSVSSASHWILLSSRYLRRNREVEHSEDQEQLVGRPVAAT
jgi:hypothetical protein